LTHVASGTYFADIVLINEAGDEVAVSARPSDAVAVALRAMCPIYASESLLEQVGEVVDEEDVTTQSEIIDEFRDFIENISPEDFSG
jgi:bifunctional DNase/RNase